MLKSLLSRTSPLAQAENQLEALHALGLDRFDETLQKFDLHPLRPIGIDTLQINLGKMCNQTCKHCHVDAGPDRKEIMTRKTLEQCLRILKNEAIKTVDLTGGAPEMNPEFRWFVKEVYALGKRILVRCNLTIILANKKHHDLPEFFKEHGVEVISSLPHYSAVRTDRQRGEGVFDRSIKALRMLNAVGYGLDGSGLELNLVYNPGGAILPAAQSGLEHDFKTRLQTDFGITFNQLFTITNMPVSRFLEYLIESGNLEEYMQKLVEAFNPRAADGVMCRSILSLGWDGYLYDCDFNQMLNMKITGAPNHIRDFDLEKLIHRTIQTNEHCFGCTAGAGSSCGGELA